MVMVALSHSQLSKKWGIGLEIRLLYVLSDVILQSWEWALG